MALWRRRSKHPTITPEQCELLTMISRCLRTLADKLADIAASVKG